METLRSVSEYEEKKDLLIIGDGWGSICGPSEVGNEVRNGAGTYALRAPIE